MACVATVFTYIVSREKVNFRDVVIHLALGVSLGYLIGILFIFDGDNDISKHIHLMEHGIYIHFLFEICDSISSFPEKSTPKPESFNLRCVIILHKATHVSRQKLKICA